MATFSATFPEARIRFQSSEALSVLLTRFWTGMSGVLTTAGPILFLTALFLACRRRRELLLCVAALVSAQVLGFFLALYLGWHGSSGAAEALIALASAYLAADVAFRPQDRGRWMLAGALGAIQGPYLVTLCRGTSAAVPFVGIIVGQVLVIALIAFGAGKLGDRRVPLRAEGAAAVLCVLGTVWFLVRLWV